jgi:hypothetical protein
MLAKKENKRLSEKLLQINRMVVDGYATAIYRHLFLTPSLFSLALHEKSNKKKKTRSH